MSQKTHYDWLWPWVQDQEIRTVIDCGGCLGHWTMFWQDKVKQIELFEPNKTTLPELKQNIQNFKNVNIHEYALGDRPGKVSMDYVKDDHVGTYAITDQQGDIEIRTLDSFNLTKLDFVKIDVDGFELNVLKGARETLSQNSPVINIEMKRDKRKHIAKQSEVILRDLGYKFRQRTRSDEVWVK